MMMMNNTSNAITSHSACQMVLQYKPLWYGDWRPEYLLSASLAPGYG